MEPAPDVTRIKIGTARRDLQGSALRSIYEVRREFCLFRLDSMSVKGERNNRNTSDLLNSKPERQQIVTHLKVCVPQTERLDAPNLTE